MSCPGKSAFVLGGTGAVGQKIVEVLSRDNNFSKVVLLGRRTIDVNDPNSKIEQRVIDFENLEDHRSDFEGFDVGFCALGTTRGASGAKGQYRVDHDYVVNSAKLARKTGTSSFCLVSSGGASENSWFPYLKTKGEMERDVKALDFDNLIIAHPGVLEGRSGDFRLTESITKVFIKPFKLFTNNIAIDVGQVAKGLVAASIQPAAAKVRIIENRELLELSKNYQ
ncbi:unnamed protein product, partial [Mesorhabditis spiculigera]